MLDELVGHALDENLDIRFAVQQFEEVRFTTDAQLGDLLPSFSDGLSASRERFGAPYEAAAIKAGQSRFRAVFLTSLTTFCGLIPLILETSEEAQLLIPMAVSLAFGILFATLITLIVIPVLLGIRLDAMALIGGSESAAETPT